jgi:diguanylate cyclase (GGDEF)-like protein
MRSAGEENTWLCPTPEDRARVVDMEQRMRPVRLLSFALMAITLIASIPWLGLWPLPLLGIALVCFVAISRALPGARRPEHLVAGAWLVSLALVTVACVKVGGGANYVLPWLAIVAITPVARFRLAVVAAAGALIVLVTLAVSFGDDPRGTWEHPVALMFDLTLVGSVLAYSLALMRADLDHRAEAFIDPLTGMLNRHALKGRIGELSAQSQVNHQPISLVLGDLDHFKAINDEHGHEQGDAVLAETAYRIRATLRAYDLAYRLGGEEFLVVMPGADTHDAQLAAEQIRSALAAQPIGEIAVTMSLGVSSSPAEEFDYETLLAFADKALYAAKRSGRNRVSVAVADAPQPVLA